jgi:hypothetical protein
MRTIDYAELLAVTGLTVERLTVLRQRDQVALAFGRGDAYASLGYLALDAVAVRLVDVLSEKIERTMAAQVVRDQWGVWSRVAAVAEDAPPAIPVLFYVIEFEKRNGRRGHLTCGSTLDSRQDDNLRKIAADLYKRTGVTARSYVVVEMHTVLDDVRRAAERAGRDFSDRFLPPIGSPALDEVLKPYDDAMPDRAVIVGKPNKVTERAKHAGVLARATMEAGSRLQ